MGTLLPARYRRCSCSTGILPEGSAATGKMPVLHEQRPSALAAFRAARPHRLAYIMFRIPIQYV